MKKVFTLYGKEKVLGKTRNVYMKANTKSKYIKYKGEFMKLKEYVKTAKIAKPVKKIKKRPVKSAKSAKSAKPTEGVLYFIYGKGGGLFDDVKFENDVRVPKQDIEALLKTLDNKDNAKKYDEICNFEYSFIINGKQYYIRPFIKIKEGHNIIFKFFFAYDGWRNPEDETLLWIEIPIHITQFFTDIADSRTGNITGSINTGINTGSRNVSTHIHITAEPEKLLDYNIYALIITKQDLYIDLRHIYLMANTIDDVIQLLRKYANKKLFSKWQKHHVGDAQHKPVQLLSYWMINNNRWRNVATPSIIQALNADNTLTEQISYDLLICINTLLSRIMIDIFKYIDANATDAVAANISIPQKIPTAYKHEVAIEIIRNYVPVGIIHERKSFKPRRYSNGKENMPPQKPPQQLPQQTQKPQPSHRQQVIQLSPLSPLSISPTPLSPLSISPPLSPPQLPPPPILPKPQQPQPISPPQKPLHKPSQKPRQKSPQKPSQKPKPQHTQPLRPSQKPLHNMPR